jgi:hypothetical protein
MLLYTNYPYVLNQMLSEFQPITLKEIDKVSLQKRKEFKFIFHYTKLQSLLKNLSQNFLILEINGERIQNYHTTYYDTDDYRMYLDHHNAKLNRYKVRVRKYLLTESEFLEVKFRNNKNITQKKRTLLKHDIAETQQENIGFIKTNTPYDFQKLHETIENTFIRMTFADKRFTQRLTIDTYIEYSNNNSSKKLNGLVIAELKQSISGGPGEVMQVMRQHEIYPQRISKYCIGQVLLNHTLKHNRFRPHIFKIRKIIENEQEFDTFGFNHDVHKMF